MYEFVGECNLCKSTDVAQLSSRDRYGFPIRAGICQWCGLVRLLDRYTPECYAEFYRSGEYRKLVSQFHGREINAETIQAEQAEYAKRVGNLLDGFVSGSQLLDIGGSTGVVAHHVARKFGMSATLIDPAADETAVAVQFGIETVNASAEDWQTERRFDLILLCQTIDHLLDPLAVLRKIRTLLKPTGIVFVDILDFEKVVRQKGIVGAVKIDHPFNFTVRTARAMFRRAQLHPEAGDVYDNHVAFILRPVEELGMGTTDAMLAYGSLLAMDMRHR